MIPREPIINANNHMLLRGDIIERHGLAVPTGMMDLEPYLQAILDHEPGMIPINGAGDVITPFWLQLSQPATIL